MISVSSAYNTIIQNGGSYEWRVLNGSTVWTVENLMEGSLASTLFETVSVGQTIAAQLDLSLWNVTPDASFPLILQFRATDGTSVSEWVTKGEYYIDTIETSPYSEVTKITAFDAMLKTEATYLLTGEWTARPATAVVGQIAEDMGVAVETATWAYITQNPIVLNEKPNIGEDGTTDREMLSYIGVLYGGNWRITPDNKLQLIRLNVSPANTADIGDAVVDFDASPAETIAKVRLWTGTSSYYLSPPLPLTTHVPENILTHSNEAIQVYATLYESYWNQIEGSYIEATLPIYGSQSVAESLYSKFGGKTFYPFSAQGAYVDPKYEVGDGIIIKDVTSIIASQTLSIDQLSPSDIELKKQESLNSLYPYISREVRAINFQISQNTALAQAASETATASAYRAQVIYKSVESGTLSLDPETTWVSDMSGSQNTWTTVRPVYSSAYPVLFLATQSQTMAQKGTDECLCTTPVKDDTTTVIDGGHITTGTIDASVVNVTNINASNISTGTLSADRIAANSIAVSKLTGSIANGNWNIDFDAGTLTIGNISASNITTGTLNVNNITISGTISDTGNKNTWDLTTGVLTTTQGFIGEWEINASGLYKQASIGDGYSEITASHIAYVSSSALEPRTRAWIDEGQISFDFYNTDTSEWEPGVGLFASSLGGIVFGTIVSGGDEIITLFADPTGNHNPDDADVNIEANLNVSGSGGNVLLIH